MPEHRRFAPWSGLLVLRTVNNGGCECDKIALCFRRFGPGIQLPGLNAKFRERKCLLFQEPQMFFGDFHRLVDAVATDQQVDHYVRDHLLIRFVRFGVELLLKVRHRFIDVSTEQHVQKVLVRWVEIFERCLARY